MPHDLMFQAYPLLLSIVKEGGRLGLQECQKQFKNEIWNCTLDNKHVFKELPIFVKTTLPYGRFVLLYSCRLIISLVILLESTREYLIKLLLKYHFCSFLHLRLFLVCPKWDLYHSRTDSTAPTPPYNGPEENK